MNLASFRTWAAPRALLDSASVLAGMKLRELLIKPISSLLLYSHWFGSRSNSDAYLCHHRPSSGGSYQGARGLDQLSSPMRSRVEIVARKSDHICVVRDVPDTRSSWYQRQQQQQQQQSSLDLPQVQGASSSQASLTGPPTGGGNIGPSATGKPSFAALLGKHPAIKEEPTTPGGSLAQPEAGLGMGRARSPASRSPATGEQITQLISMISELKSDIRQDLSQLGRRVDSMENSVSRVTQTVNQLDKHHLIAATAESRRPSGTSSAAPATGSQTGSRRGSSNLLPAPAPPASLADGSSSMQTTDEARRDRSKSPHRHHHHHHHHHHRKASHSTPGTTPTALEDPPSVDRTSQEKQRPLQQMGSTVVADMHKPRQASEDDDDQDATSKL